MLHRAVATALALAIAAAGVAVALEAGGEAGSEGPAAPAVASAAGSISIGNSHSGRAVLTARDVLPGEAASGRVRISNPNRQPLTTSLELRHRAPPGLADSINLRIRDLTRGTRLYSGTLAGAKRLPLRAFAPRERRAFGISAELDSGAGDALQGRSASFDLVWRARAAAPPPECRIRNMRARLFIFRGRNVIRLVSRYRAAVPAKVAIDFHLRRRGGRAGPRIGRLVTRFGRRPYRWGMNRVAVRRPPRVMRLFRRYRRGFTATLRVSNAPGYCRQYLNLDLVQLKRFFRQFVWFQRGSFRTR